MIGIIGAMDEEVAQIVEVMQVERKREQGLYDIYGKENLMVKML
mgnify:CR=1 FL=1